MAGQEWLAERFEENRSRLRAVAYRMVCRSKKSPRLWSARLRQRGSSPQGVAQAPGYLLHLFEQLDLRVALPGADVATLWEPLRIFQGQNIVRSVIRLL